MCTAAAPNLLNKLKAPLARALAPDVPQLPQVPQSVTAPEAATTSPLQTAADPARKGAPKGRRALRVEPSAQSGASGTRAGLTVPGA